MRVPGAAPVACAWLRRAAAAAFCIVFATPAAAQPPPQAAYLIRQLDEGARTIAEARPDVLDTPVLPGSVVKAATLVAAFETGTIDVTTTHLCRRVVTADGVRYTCSHPDLKRPLTPAEALAHSCNDFFVSLAARLPREALNRVRIAAGLPPVGAGVPLAGAAIGLAGERVAPRLLLSMLSRLVGAGDGPHVPMKVETKAALLAGLRGAAHYGTASEMAVRGVPALAKTGTSPMPGGGSMGIFVALTPDDRPSRGVVLVAPGAAGLDAAALAADLLQPAAPRTTVRLARTRDDGSVAIDRLPLDDYIAEVVAGEIQPSAKPAAHEALAIVARTFARANAGRHAGDGYDFCDSTHCQVVRRATTAARQAVAATAGQLLLQQGRPAQVFHSAWCGGHPARASEVWPGAADLPGVPSEDEACASAPAWRTEISATDLERVLRAMGRRGNTLRDLRVVQRTPGGRVLRLRADGMSPPEVSGEDLRLAVGRLLGWQWLKSTAFDVERTSRGFRFAGRGFGHGVGLCVLGAGHRATRGDGAAAILAFYFPGLMVGRVEQPSAAVASLRSREAGGRTPGGTGAVPGGAGAHGDVTLALPAAEERERDVLLAAIRRASDEIAARTGLPAPDRVRVTVHPTVEAFGRVTGQPWFVAGATSGHHIHLLPLAVLRKQGQLERVLHHEIAHVFVDDVLRGRPLWVREGAAMHFSASVLGTSGAASGRCPDDEALHRPASAGALREAYAAARACFERALAGGRPWTGVGGTPVP